MPCPLNFIFKILCRVVFCVNEYFDDEIIIEDPDEYLAQKKDSSTSIKTFVFDWLEVLVHAIIAVVICFSFIFRIATIDGPSMMDTLQHGERVIITNLFYEPKVGDVVVISRNKENSVYTMNETNTPIIKRIIATEGQTVDIDFHEGIVYVDGVALDEPYTKTPTNYKVDVEFPVVVDEGCVFVLGDNRNVSSDSRDSSIGMIDTRYILGRAVYRVFPLNKIGKIDE